MNKLVCSLFLAAAASLPAGCEKGPTDRAGRLLSMAGQEAASISNDLDRFTRQLNVAWTQLRTDRKSEAAKTLLLARDTLASAKREQFDDLHRIAGWTAISQLSRQAGDRDLALKSSDLALAALNNVQPAAERPQYVLSLAGELADLRGNAAAVELLDSGSTWAADIRDANIRRTALVAFADRLISLDAYENARTTLRKDPDAAWRTDTFIALANGYATKFGTNNATLAFRENGRVGAGGAGGRSADERNAAPAVQLRNVSNSFGKDVRFESVYQQAQ